MPSGTLTGRKPADHRLVLDGILWIARTGAPWRDLPIEFGKWSSVYRQFRRWTIGGLREDILDALNHAKLAPDKLQMVDSTVIRAHHHAAGAKGGLRKRLLAVREVGSRPGSIYASTARPPPMRTEITPGQDSDYTGCDLVMADNLPQPAVLVADGGYDSEKFGKISRAATPCQ
ncbi:IS5 family transposase [Paracoccus sp. J56]|uniref:IS5 family transposase n=1 Tax=Paracoccus sp. J56 TaxID=935850 RepID=UPI000A09DFD5|nr:IS5 family transposase [Paracoccus sp. J56]SMG57080.1 Putative transposase of IS4/5 family [Paracoccus sp. J56]